MKGRLPPNSLVKIYNDKMKQQELDTMKNIIHIQGQIETSLSDDEWLKQFVQWLESREEHFEGLIKDETNDQSWFWSEEWQAGEREAEEDIKAGRVKRANSVKEFLKDLEDETGE